MQGTLAGRLALLACLAAAPLAATEVYVPALNPATANDGSKSETELWISNPGQAAASFKTTFLNNDTDGTQRSGTSSSVQVLPGRAVNVTKIAQLGKVGLVAVEVGSGLLVEARLLSTAQSGAVSIGRVPVISAANSIAAGSKAQLVGLERDTVGGRLLHFGIVNLASQAATCQVTFVTAGGSTIGATISLPLKPLSLLHYQDALGILNAGRVAGVRAEVSCNQPFFAYGAEFIYPNSHYLFVTPANPGTGGGGGGGGSVTPTPTPSPTPTPGANSYVFAKSGLVHEVTAAVQKGIVPITVPGPLVAKRMVVDMEFVPGPWNTTKIPGNHAVIWLYRGKFRGNTIANVNAFGPGKYTLKASQNMDLEAHQFTAAEKSITFVQGQRYHLHYVYDAANLLVTATLSSGGQTLITMSFAATTETRNISVPAEGLNCEFGHYATQLEGPEVASFGWKYYDLRVEIDKL